MDLVRLKGTGDGVKIYLSPDGDIASITHALHDKLGEFRKFFGSGHCNIYIIGRELSPSDRMRLEAIVSAMLPESTVNYGERKLFRTMRKEKEPQKQEDAEAVEEKPAEPDTPTIPVEQIKEVVTDNFKSSRARFFDGVVKAGRIVESDGHMVLMGSVEKGGKLIAAGNIIVMGAIYGEAEAGCMGSRGAYIAALELSPQKLSIAGKSMAFGETEEGEAEAKGPQKAYLINNEIEIEKFWLK